MTIRHEAVALQGALVTHKCGPQPQTSPSAGKGVPWLFTDHHHIIPRPTEPGTRFEQSGRFAGILAHGLHRIGPDMYGTTRRGSGLMNDALRGKVEEGRSCAGTGVEAAGEVERGNGRLVGRATIVVPYGILGCTMVEILLYQWRHEVTKILPHRPTSSLDTLTKEDLRLREIGLIQIYIAT